MIQFTSDVYFVEGAKNGAIYDLAKNRVFAVNASAVKVIHQIAAGKRLETYECEYKQMLKDAGLFDESFTIREVTPDNMPELMRDTTFDLVWLELTHACNLKCIHCYEGDVHRRTVVRLTFEQWRKVIDQISELGSKGIVVIGGEPSIHPDACRILRYLKEKGLAASFFTNATFDDRELKATLLETGTALRVSLYGHVSAVHDKITQVPGSFEHTVANIKWFLAQGLPVHVSVIFMRENEAFRNEIESFVRGLGVSGYKFDVIRCVHGGNQESHLPVLNDMKRMGRIREAKFRISREKFMNALHFNPCWNRKLVVSEDGTVLPCEFAREIRIANVQESSLSEIVKSDALLRCWRLSMDHITICRVCEFRYACRDCRPYAMAKRNCRNDKTPRCDYNPEKGVWENE